MCIMQLCSGITHGRMLNGELFAQRLQKVSLFAFVYRLFHDGFSLIIGTNIQYQHLHCQARLLA